MYNSDSAKAFITQFFGSNPQELTQLACKVYSGGDSALEKRLYNYVYKGWFKFATPLFSNLINERNLPISCFLCHVDDTLEGLIEHDSEVKRITVRGGGVSGDWSLVRPENSFSPGPIGFMGTVNASLKAFRQGTIRKGSYAAYINISHPSILEFISMRIPSGDLGRKNLDLHHAINISDKFMEAVVNNDIWDFIDPNSGKTTGNMDARRLWELILETRYRTGEPFLNFIDTVRKDLPDFIRKQGYEINCSNLCNEIHLPTGTGLTAVCCLSSVNLAQYEEWKDTQLIQDLVEMLDNVIEIFLQKAPDTMSSSKNGARLFRPLGLGVLGLAQLYQKKNLPFDSKEAANLNKQVFSLIKKNALEKSIQLSFSRGEPETLIGQTKRNSHLLAVAPTANSATILNTSPSIEPWPANVYTNRTKCGSILIKNPELDRLLSEKGLNTEEVWEKILLDEGSVGNINGLSQHEKNVFKTAYEIDQFQIIRQASDRQKYICQGQSLTLFLNKNFGKAMLHKLHHMAWKTGCKGLYYVRTKASHKVETLSDCAGCQA